MIAFKFDNCSLSFSFQYCKRDFITPCADDSECFPMCSSGSQGICDLTLTVPVCFDDTNGGGTINQ